MKQLNVRKDCTARVFKANMIIPQVAKNLTQSNNFEIPTDKSVKSILIYPEMSSATHTTRFTNIIVSEAMELVTEVPSIENSSIWAKQLMDMSSLIDKLKVGTTYTISADFICTSIPEGVDSKTIGFQFIKKQSASTLAISRSYAIGLNEVYHFSKTFKKHTGQTPRDWRNHHE